jgi:hypothetical protein
MLARCHDTPAVQLVERPQIAMAGPLGINSSGAERIFYALQHWPISVIAPAEENRNPRFIALAED